MRSALVSSSLVREWLSGFMAASSDRPGGGGDVTLLWRNPSAVLCVHGATEKAATRSGPRASPAHTQHETRAEGCRPRAPMPQIPYEALLSTLREAFETQETPASRRRTCACACACMCTCVGRAFALPRGCRRQVARLVNGRHLVEAPRRAAHRGRKKALAC